MDFLYLIRQMGNISTSTNKINFHKRKQAVGQKEVYEIWMLSELEKIDPTQICIREPELLPIEHSSLYIRRRFNLIQQKKDESWIQLINFV